MIVVNKFADYCIENSSTSRSKHEYVSSFLTHLFKQGLAWTTVNVYYSALRLLFTFVLKKEWNYEMIPRPRARKSLPNILSGRQIESMINSIKNLKHKTIIVLMYSTGLRISEVVNLKVSHILIDRQQIKIVDGKGGKDRFVFVPATAISMFHSYLSKYKPDHFFFQGMKKNQAYSFASIRKVIVKAASKANIPFNVKPHSLRYAYATHHIENGTDLVTLQYQLGHNNIHTTIKYIKLCKFKNRKLNHPIQKLNILLPGPIT